MNKTQRHLIEYITRDVILYYSQENNLPLDEAMGVFMKSDIFEKLQDIDSGLYTESASYVYELFQNEYKNA